jgi:hypothetical protein
MVKDLDSRSRELSDLDRRISILKSRIDITPFEQQELEILTLARCVAPGDVGGNTTAQEDQ